MPQDKDKKTENKFLDEDGQLLTVEEAKKLGYLDDDDFVVEEDNEEIDERKMSKAKKDKKSKDEDDEKYEDEDEEEKKVKKESKDEDDEKYEDEDEDEEKNPKKNMKKEDIDFSELNIDGDIETIFGEEELSDEFREKAKTVYEAAVRDSVKKNVISKLESLEKELQESYDKALAAQREQLIESVDSYMNYVAEEWKEENKIAIERGLKTEITESFIEDLRNVFEEHNIDVPEDKVDLVDELQEKIETLEEKVNKTEQKNAELFKEKNELYKNLMVDELCSDLSDNGRERMKELCEHIDTDDGEEFLKQARVIKDRYFGESEENDDGEETTLTEDVSSEQPEKKRPKTNMDRYLNAMSRSVQQEGKLSNKP